MGTTYWFNIKAAIVYSLERNMWYRGSDAIQPTSVEYLLDEFSDLQTSLWIKLITLNILYYIILNTFFDCHS